MEEFNQELKDAIGADLIESERRMSTTTSLPELMP
jgi:hypothetical protein